MAYRCKDCKDSFLRKSMLDRHHCSSSGQKLEPQTCEDCGTIYISKEVLLRHECRKRRRVSEDTTSTTATLVKCKYCEAQFTNPNTLKVHERVHTGDLPYKCQECGEKFPYHSNLRSHMRIHNDPIDRPHKCNQCGAKFSQLANLQSHERTHDTDRMTTCDKCKGLIPENCTHVCPDEGSDPFYVCVECNARFTVKHTLEVHMRTHTGERPYKCTQCNERFIQPGALQSHLRTHTTRLDHECGECGQRFATEDRLRDHVRTHAQFTLHKCSVCQAAFANESRLLVHMEQKHILGDKRSHNCNQCSESFSTDDELKSHMKNAHPDVDAPKYKCTKCPDAFTTFMLLQNHMRDAHPSPNAPYENSDFRCDECGCKYTTKNRLIAHRRVKHPEKSTSAQRQEANPISSPTPVDKQLEKPSEPQDDNQKGPESRPKEHGSPSNSDEPKGEDVASASTDNKLKRKKSDSSPVPAKKSAKDRKGSKSLQCTECDESFESQYQLHIHEQGHKYEKSCDKCGNERCTCDVHVPSGSKRGRKPGIYKCDRCNRKCVGRQELSEHNCIANSGDDDNSGDERKLRSRKSKTVVRKSPAVVPHPVSAEIKMQKCPECNIRFTRKHLVDMHLLSVHKMTFRDCSVCSKPFSHPIQVSKGPKDKIYTCATCDHTKNKSEKSDEEASVSNKEASSRQSIKPEGIGRNKKDGPPMLEQQPVKNEDSSLGNEDGVMDSIVDDMIANDDGGDDMAYDIFAAANQEDDDDDGDDDADDTEGVPIIEVQTAKHSGHIVDIVGPATKVKTEPDTEDDSDFHRSLVKSENTVSANTLSDNVNNSSLSQLVPKLIRILALNGEGGQLEDFGWPTASSEELIERVVIHYGGTPAQKVGARDEILASNCKELFILCIGLEGTEKLLDGQTIEEVIADVIANEESGNAPT